MEPSAAQGSALAEDTSRGTFQPPYAGIKSRHRVAALLLPCLYNNHCRRNKLSEQQDRTLLHVPCHMAPQILLLVCSMHFEIAVGLGCMCPTSYKKFLASWISSNDASLLTPSNLQEHHLIGDVMSGDERWEVELKHRSTLVNHGDPCKLKCCMKHAYFRLDAGKA
jgi:hypothetical protein